MLFILFPRHVEYMYSTSKLLSLLNVRNCSLNLRWVFGVLERVLIGLIKPFSNQSLWHTETIASFSFWPNFIYYKYVYYKYIFIIYIFKCKPGYFSLYLSYWMLSTLFTIFSTKNLTFQPMSTLRPSFLRILFYIYCI